MKIFMLRYFKFFLLTVTFNILLISNVGATHISGGDFSYTCVGPNQYEITLNLYYDCSASLTPPSPSLSITFSNTCNVANPPTTSLQLQNPGGTEISQLCPAQQNNSTCNNGTLPGMSVWTYTGIVTLPANCNYTMVYSLCCRNTAVNVQNSTGDNIVVVADIDNTVNNCNNSPQFTSQPIPYVCSNQPVTYNFGAIEPDGDSLVFSLVSALSSATANVTYAGGYSAAQPIPGANITTNTGQLTFTPTTLGFFIFVIQVDEYDDNGNFLGSVRRDIQFVVQNCTNDPIDQTSGPIQDFSGSATLMSPFDIEMCEGDNFTFNAVFTDPNSTDSVSFTSNINSVLPGATIVRNPASAGDSLVVTVSWTAPAGSAGLNNFFVIEASDNACPVPSLFSVIYDVKVIQSTVITPTRTTICGPQTSILNASGGTEFTWSILAGGFEIPIPQDSVFPLPYFSCNPCASPEVQPPVTTTFIVESDLSVGCNNRDTITINVAADFLFDIITDKDSLCLNDSVQFNVIADSAFNYTYNWSPNTFLNNDTIPNPQGVYTSGGTYNYELTIESMPGCNKKDSVQIRVSPNLPPNISLEYAPICYDDSVQLNVDFGFVVPSACGPSSTTCTSIPDSLDAIGSGINTSTNAYPTPFTGFWHDGRIQMMLTAAELNSIGFDGGVISEIAFNVTNKASTQPYNGFTVRIACTSLSSLSTSSGFQTSGFTTVHTSTYTTTAGWNYVPFNVAEYDWDGTSNLIVEICFDNTSWTSNDVVQKVNTPFVSSILRYQDNAVGCNLVSNLQYNERPLIRMKYCEGADPTQYHYTWTPANLLNDSTIPSPLAFQDTSIANIFTVIVTDIIGGCFDTDTVEVIPVTNYDLTITPVPVLCSVDDTIQLVTATPGLGVWSGPGIIDSINGVFDPQATTQLNNLVSYFVPGACGGTETINIEVIQLPDPTITQVGTLCSDDSIVTMTAATPGGSWLSLPNAAAIDAATGNFDPTQAASGNNTIRYVINVGACQDSAQITVPVLPRAVATITSTLDSICENAANTTLTSGQTGGTWSATPVAGAITSTGSFRPTTAGAGTHTVTYTIAGACGASDSRQIEVVAPPVVTVDLVDPLCEADDEIQLTANLGGGEWTSAPVAAAINLSSGIFNPTVAGPGNHTITYEYEDSPCVVIANTSVTVKPTPASPNVTIPEAPCFGQLYDPILVSGNIGGDFVWYADADLQNFLDTTSSYDFQGTATDTLYVTNILNGCEGEATEVILPFNQLPNISFEATPEFGPAPLSVIFNNTSDSASNPFYEWEWENDGVIFSELVSPTEIFTDPGTYNIVLYGTDENGCVDTAQGIVVVDFIIPNVFSPNGDGQNDKFFDISQTTININNFEGRIANRWGNMVYEWTDNNGWDGRTNGGNEVPAGTYFYMLSGTRDDGEVFQKEGTITLLR